ncbi:hypothetical protein, conserved [Thermococcus onnurineus NA1]|uniref:Uncharacterized protein n=1 Tax=Thermococcus onnurineus (strain NA1) TaxID=523850 RepID=B6YUT3_THEON|nr:hypothetical protein [Thermococcus onnurineus]ACJ16119.1 hypothetical protein, conserved [Thermococcus onnurineus NA1]
MIYENVKKVEIKVVNGVITIEGWDENFAEVDYTVHGEVEVIIEQLEDKLVIEEKPKGMPLNLRNKSGWAKIEIMIPKSAVIAAKNVNGTPPG